MSTKFKILKMIAGMLFVSNLAISQTTVELPLIPFLPDGNGITSNPRIITFQQDVNNAGAGFTSFTPGIPPTAVKLTVSLGTQTYSGLTYGNCPTGIIFGAGPDNATGGGGSNSNPTANAISNYSILGAFNGTGALGPQNNMFNSTAIPAVGATGTGIDAINSTGSPNGGVSLFTAAQALFDGPGGTRTYDNTTKYDFGTIVLTFSQFVTNPIIHIAGLGGSYRYQFQNGPSGEPLNYKSTFFTTELELISPLSNLEYMSGNPNFSISGRQINNTAVDPNGGSAPQIPLIGIFDNFGAASGSFRVFGTVKTLVFKVTLRGGQNGQFPWSVLKSAVQGANRAPFTGDIWSISANFEPAQLIPLPSTGVQLAGALNGNNVQLNWKTQTEINSKHFEIERSTDGVNFSGIGIKDAAGNSVSERNYDYLDVNVQSEVTYYRLKMVDIDTRFAYSNIVVIRKSKGDIKGVRIYPNPSNGIFNLEFSNAKGTYMMGLYNQAGQEVMRKQLVVDANVQNLPVGTGNLPAGTYLLSIRNSTNTEVYSQQVILTK